MAEYLQCGKDVEYEVVQLLSALFSTDDPRLTTHGKMTVVILYCTHFVNKHIL